jgi:hypothetical protein
LGYAAAWSAMRSFSTKRHNHFGTGPPTGSSDFFMEMLTASAASRATNFAETRSSAAALSGPGGLKMPTERSIVTREGLFELLWKSPLRDVAREFHLAPALGLIILAEAGR